MAKPELPYSTIPFRCIEALAFTIVVVSRVLERLQPSYRTANAFFYILRKARPFASHLPRLTEEEKRIYLDLLAHLDKVHKSQVVDFHFPDDDDPKIVH